MKAFEEIYCVTDGYSKHIQVLIALEDKERTTFTSPFDTYVLDGCRLVDLTRQP